MTVTTTADFARTRRFLWLAGLPLLYVVACVLAWAFESRLVYQPARAMRATPADHGVPFEDLTLTAADGMQIHAWFIPAENPRATVLYAHGTKGNLSTNLKRILPMRDAGFSVLAFDYRGYGTSGGGRRDLGEEATYRDGEAAWRWLTDVKGLAPEDIVIWGRSLGGGVASWLAAKHGARALVLESTFTSIADVGARTLFFLPVHQLANVRYPTHERLGGIGSPVLVSHAKDDRRVLWSHAEKNFAAVASKKKFVETTGGHGDGIALTPGAMDEVVAFLSPAE